MKWVWVLFVMWSVVGCKPLPKRPIAGPPQGYDVQANRPASSHQTFSGTIESVRSAAVLALHEDGFSAAAVRETDDSVNTTWVVSGQWYSKIDMWRVDKNGTEPPALFFETIGYSPVALATDALAVYLLDAGNRVWRLAK